MWLDEVCSQYLAMDNDHEDCRDAKIVKKKQDMERPRKVNKKHLYILFNLDIKAFQGWKVIVELWFLATCEKFLK